MKSRKIDLMIIGTTLCVLGIAYLGYFHGVIGDIRSLRREARELRPQLLVVAKLERDVALARQIVGAAEQNRDTARARLLRGREVEGALSSVFRIAQECGLEISMTRPGKVAAKGLYAEQPVQLKAKASFPDFYRFLSSIEQMQTAFEVRGMSISRQGEGDRVEVMLDLALYLDREESKT